MSSSTVPEIKVIYSASGKTTRAVRPRSAGAVSLYPILVGFMGLLVAMVMFYATWWPLEKHVGTTMIMKAPMPLSPAQADALSRAISGGEPKPIRRGRGTAPRLNADEASVPVAAPGHKYQGITAINVICKTPYYWQALTSVAFCVLALAAGGAWSASSAGGLKFGARVLAGLTLVGILLYAGYVWHTYERAWPMFAIRYVIAGLMGLALLLGVGFGRGGRRLNFVAGVLLILAAGGSAAGLHLWTQAGALTGFQATLAFMVLVFCIHSAYGWLLLLLARRLPIA